MNERAVISARVSDDHQRGNYSIPTQLAACLAYLEENEYVLVGDRFVDLETGLDAEPGDTGIVAAYVDDYTSTEISRPALDAAFRYLELQGFDVLVVYDLDRLARDPYIRQTLERTAQQHGARVEYVRIRYDDTPEGDVRKDLDATFAKWENAKRVERANRGKIGKAKRGLFVHGAPPYGYVQDEHGLGRLAVNADEARIVQRIFRMYTEDGKSIRGIAEALTEEQVPPARGGSGWAKSTVRRILGNEAYVGCLYYNRRKRKHGELVARDRSKWIEIPVEPVVEELSFREAQLRLKRNRKVRRRQPKRFYLLSGMVVCGACERPYFCETAKAGRNRRATDASYYRHRKKNGQCRNHVISARRLDPAVWAEVEKLLLDPERLREGYESSMTCQEDEQALIRQRLETLDRDVSRLEKQLQNLTMAYTDPDIGMSKPEYLAQRQTVGQQLADIKEQMPSLQRQLVAPAMSFSEFEKFATRIRTFLESGQLTPKRKRRIMELLHIQVVIGKDNSACLRGWILSTAVGLSGTAS